MHSPLVWYSRPIPWPVNLKEREPQRRGAIEGLLRESALRRGTQREEMRLGVMLAALLVQLLLCGVSAQESWHRECAVHAEDVPGIRSSVRRP